ncbi:MAG: hypothetical protein H6978_06705 [Gammaproteobacteria bacterium]|nr:hypothetical protein [Gammaproteobacteria bacterium]
MSDIEAFMNPSKPLRCFIRDDDGGWDDDKLLRLLRAFADRGLPIDVAMIPIATTSALALRLQREDLNAAHGIGYHQHGFAHLNHETQGRKCEFGGSRSWPMQHADIADGQQRLRDLMGSALDPIFTPPWNRCLPQTLSLLDELGFAAISTIKGSALAASAPLAQIPVTIDFQKRSNGERLQWPEFCGYANKQMAGEATVGIMLHHQTMTAEDFQHLFELLAGWQRSGNVEFCAMRDLLPACAVAAA